MILHLQAAGVPTSWSLVALYNGAYGIALNSARSWSEQHKGPHFLIEIEDGSVKRTDLVGWDESNLKSQKVDRNPFIQLFDTTFHLDSEITDLACSTLRAKMVEIGYFIPRAEWEQRYPGQALTEAHFNEFHKAYNAAMEAGEPLKFSERLIPYIGVPDDYEVKYQLTQTEGGQVIVGRDPKTPDPTNGHVWTDSKQASDALRLLNSGFTYDEVLILFIPEPVEV